MSRYFQGDVLKTATEEVKQLKKDVLKQLKVSEPTRIDQKKRVDCNLA